MHHGMCDTHGLWCMSGSLTPCGRENVPGIPGACATCNFRYQVRGPWNASSESQSFQTLEGDPSCCVMTSLWCALNNIFTIYAKLRFNNIKYSWLWTGVCYTSLMRQNFPGKNPYDFTVKFSEKNGQTRIDVMSADDLYITAYQWTPYCWFQRWLWSVVKEIDKN